MTKGVMGFMKGAGTGIALGCVVGAIGSGHVLSNKKASKRTWARRCTA